MFQTLTNYFNAQRPRVARAAGYAGAVYLVGRYVGERLEEVRNRLLHDRMAREKYVLGHYFSSTVYQTESNL